MGKIVTSRTDIHGVKKETVVRTNAFEDLVMNTVWKLFGRGPGWRLVHFVERRKLKKQ